MQMSNLSRPTVIDYLNCTKASFDRKIIERVRQNARVTVSSCLSGLNRRQKSGREVYKVLRVGWKTSVKEFIS